MLRTVTLDVSNCTEPVQQGEEWITCPAPIEKILVVQDMEVDTGLCRRIRAHGLCHTHLMAMLHETHLAEERGELVMEPIPPQHDA